MRSFARSASFALRCCPVLAVLVAFACAAAAAEAPVYRVPPTAVADLLTAPRLPRTAPDLSPDGAWLLQSDLRSLIPIATLAEPVEKLAGFEVLPGLHAMRGALKNAAAGLTFHSIRDGRTVRAQLPEGAQVAGTAWSARGDRVACAVFAPGGATLWVIDAATGAARELKDVHLQGVPRVFMTWMQDDAALLCALVPGDSPAAAPPVSRVPEGPALRVSTGRAAPQRTARDVLRTREDVARFTQVVTAQVARVLVADGWVQPLGAPVMLAEAQLSPDERWLRVTRFGANVPVGFPAPLFPTVTEIWPVAGGAPVRIGETPLNDRSAIASVAPLGARAFTWAVDGRSLWGVAWQDRPGANAGAAVRDTTLPPPGEDRLLRWDAPFTAEPREVARCEWPVSRLLFTANGARLVVDEDYEPRRVERQWWLDVRDPLKRGTLVQRSTEGVYDDPGNLVTRSQSHQRVVVTTPDGAAYWRSGDGFRADGQRPFLDRRAFAGGAAERVFESEAQVLEQPLTLLAEDGSRIVTLRQSATAPPNYFLRAGRARPRALTAFTNPLGALTSAQRFSFEFKRADGVTLHAEAVLPASWKPGTALPTVFWIYPNDYSSAAAASQNRTSPNRFPSQSALNPEVLVSQGYAVVRPDLAIVGSNDRYVDELRASAQAAVDECVRRGFTDRNRIAVGGHSYGAFSTVNCLAHTKLFRAGLASDGAYNRTLTPFTFQAETRNLWEAPETYLQMSPFLHADQIDAPLLLMHNQDDTNVGTHPIQSDRLFEAMNGLGKTVQLVQYPYEDHGPAARETVLDYWARALEWFDRYVKNAPGPTETRGGQPQVP